MTAPSPNAAEPTTDAAAQEQRTPETDWVAEARKWEQRAKENKSAADRLKALEDEKKSTEQRAAEREAAAEKRAVDAEARAARRDIALEYGLSKDDAGLLDHLTDEGAMRAVAGRLSAQASEQIKNGNYAPTEGRTPPPPTPDEKTAFARQLFASGDQT